MTTNLFKTDKQLNLILWILTFGLFSCSPRIIIPTGEVNYISTGDGTISLNSVGYGKNEGEAFMNAELNAINALLFRGIPSSEQKTALIGSNESDIRFKYKNYFNEFYSNYRYKTFVLSTYPTTGLTNLGNGIKSVSADITLNLRSLRADLEEHGVIRKFGY